MELILESIQDVLYFSKILNLFTEPNCPNFFLCYKGRFYLFREHFDEKFTYTIDFIDER